MPNPVGGPSGIPGPPVIPAGGSLWVFTGGKWIASSSLPGPLTVIDAQFSVVGSSDATKATKIESDTQATGSTLTYDVGAQTASRRLTAPVLTADATLAVLSETQTFSGAKTFSAITTVSDTTSASSPTVGAAVFGNGVAATSVAIGSGNINAGGTITTGGDIVVSKSINGSAAVVSINSNAGAAAYCEVATFNGTDSLGLRTHGTGHATLASQSWFGTNTATPLILSTAGSERARISGTGLVTFASSTNATSISAAAVIDSGGHVVTKNIIGAMGRGTGVTSTATAAGTTTLTATSTEVQSFTGATTQTVQFPAANLFGAGIAVLFAINNQSSGTVTPTRAGADTFQGGGTADPVLAGATMRYASNGVSVWLKI